MDNNPTVSTTQHVISREGRLQRHLFSSTCNLLVAYMYVLALVALVALLALLALLAMSGSGNEIKQLPLQIPTICLEINY